VESYLNKLRQNCRPRGRTRLPHLAAEKCSLPSFSDALERTNHVAKQRVLAPDLADIFGRELLEAKLAFSPLYNLNIAARPRNSARMETYAAIETPMSEVSDGGTFKRHLDARGI